MSKILRSALVCAALAPAAANATPIEISQMFTLTQDILVTAVGDPTYYDTYTETYPWWDEYHRVLTQEADVWDPSQIPTSVAEADSNPILSTGDGWAVMGLDSADINSSALDGANGLIGSINAEFWARIISASGTAYEYTSGAMNVYALDDQSSPIYGDLDLLGIEFMNEFDAASGSNGSAVFLIAFGVNYFETLTGGGVIDFTQSIISGVDAYFDTYDYSGNPLFEEYVYGEAMGPVLVEAYDGVLGDGTMPAVPLPAGLPLMLGAFGAFAALRRRK